MKRPSGWRRKWLTEGFGLGPFAFGNQIEMQLRREIPFAEFSTRVNNALVGLERPLPSSTLAWLYAMSLGARSEKETVELARRTMMNRSWRKRETHMAELLRLLNAYPTFDPERALRKLIGSRKDSRTRRRAAQLAQNLGDLKYQLEWWSGFARWGSWQEDYRGYLAVMDRHLQKHRRAILKTETQRVEVIWAAIDAIGLKETSPEAISRMLRRETRKKRQYYKP